MVTTDCGGPVDIIERNKYGVTFGNGRSISAATDGAEAIIDVLEKKWNVIELREKALSYSIENIVPSLMEFIGNR